MIFNQIDLQTWNRKETYDQYITLTPCTYSMTVNLDITTLMEAIKQKGLPFFPVLLYGITGAVNSHPEFRMDLDEAKRVGYYDCCNPCYTVFHGETETFTNVWTAYDADFEMFFENYRKDMLLYQSDCKRSKPRVGRNLFSVSCIPWTSFTGFNLHLEKGYDYFPPIFTIGKYFADGAKIQLLLAVQVHHAVCDGFHLSRFLADLQQWADEFTG